MSLFAGTATPTIAAPQAVEGTIDWTARKAEILGRLDLVAEYKALGVRFVQPVPDASGRLACYAVDRDEENPSAVVFLPSGVYHDSGSTGKAIGFFDFALKHGDHGKFADVLKHYGEKAGLALGRIPVHKNGVREAVYLYEDASGDARYAAFRYRQPNGKKKFTLHKSDGRGGWRWEEGNMAGVEPLPYRLPQLLAADPDEHPVYIVEGEKVAERAARAGLVATTNHMGSNATDKTWPRFAEHFRGRTCFVLPDNDGPGRAHAAKVCGHLAGVAAAIKLVELPGLPPSGDLDDWLDMGHELAELAALAHRAPAWSGSIPPPPIAGTIQAAASEPDPADGLPCDDDVQTTCMADVEAIEVEWLWPDRVPLGKLTLLAGEAKMGKSFLTMDFIARVSAGLEIPCGGGECMPRGSVILLSAEDDLADTIKPRLAACEADFAKIHALTTIRMPNGILGPFNLSYVPHLERAVLRSGDCKLVVIDPVPHYVGNGTDDHKNAQTRQLLEPLKDLASRLRIAVLMVTHLNKGTGTKALNRVTGSGAYTALARSNWLVVKDKDDPKRRLFLSAGTNLVEDPAGLAYRIDRETRRIVWEPQPVLMTADEALAASMEAKKVDDRPVGAKVNKADQARDFLIDLLGNGQELPHAEIVVLANAQGITKNAIFDAKEAAGIKPRKSGFQGKWVWSIPAAAPPPEVDPAIF